MRITHAHVLDGGVELAVPCRQRASPISINHQLLQSPDRSATNMNLPHASARDE